MKALIGLYRVLNNLYSVVKSEGSDQSAQDSGEICAVLSKMRSVICQHRSFETPVLFSEKGH